MTTCCFTVPPLPSPSPLPFGQCPAGRWFLVKSSLIWLSGDLVWISYPWDRETGKPIACTWHILKVLPWRWWSQCSVPEGRKGTSHPRNSCWSLCLCILSWPSCKSHNIQLNRTQLKIGTALVVSAHKLTWYNARKLWQIFVPQYQKNTFKTNLSSKCIKT